MRADNPSHHPTDNPATPLIQEDASRLTSDRGDSAAEYPPLPSLQPSTTNSRVQCTEKSPPRSKPLFQGFERPSFSRIVILTVLCLTAYPAFYALTFVARDRTLFIVRLIVSIWCSGVGLALGYILLKIGAQHLEAATWATVIHVSHEGGGMKLRDLARSSTNPTSFMPAFHILRYRCGNRGTARRSRRPYDKRPWSLFLGLFAVLVILGPLLPLLFGRIIEIKIFVRNQHKVYGEVLIAGDLSQEDLDRAATQFAKPEGDAAKWPWLPYGRSLLDTAKLSFGNDTVYFAEPIPSQFVPGGSGAGTFDSPASIGSKDATNNTQELTGRMPPQSGTGAVLRYPQWGIRIHCEKLPDPEVNLIPLPDKGYTYVFVPQSFIRGLFRVYGMDLPMQFTKPDLDELMADDTIPSNIDPSTISYLSKRIDARNSFVTASNIMLNTTIDQGWMAVETFFLQLNVSRTPSGHFPVYSTTLAVEYPEKVEVRLGYDAVVCVQRYEPWIIEAYNTSTGSSSASRIIEIGNDSTPLSPSGNIRGDRIMNTRNLNKTGKGLVFEKAYYRSLDLMSTANPISGQVSSYYAPTPAIVSFTEGTESLGYTELSPVRFANIRARASAAKVLPYLAGSGPVVAQSYGDEALAYATYKPWQLISSLVLVWILGIIGELFVPTLPLNIPRREFGVYSWLALFKSQELQFEAADDLDKLMSLDELEDKFSDRRVEFVVEKGET